MSDTQIKAFIEAARADAGLQQRLSTATDVDAVVAIARDAGFALEKKALLEYRGSPGQLDEAQLEQVSGGLGQIPQLFSLFRFNASIPGNDLGPDNTQRTVSRTFNGADLLSKSGPR